MSVDGSIRVRHGAQPAERTHTMMCNTEIDPVDEARREAWANPPDHDEAPRRSDFDGDDTSDDALAYRAQLPLAERVKAVRAAVTR